MVQIELTLGCGFWLEADIPHPHKMSRVALSSPSDGPGIKRDKRRGAPDLLAESTLHLQSAGPPHGRAHCKVTRSREGFRGCLGKVVRRRGWSPTRGSGAPRLASASASTDCSGQERRQGGLSCH